MLRQVFRDIEEAESRSQQREKQMHDSLQLLMYLSLLSFVFTSFVF